LEGGYPHRVHRSKKGRKPAAKHFARRAIRPYLEHLRRKAEERADDE
jgi:hypothetical protein